MSPGSCSLEVEWVFLWQRESELSQKSIFYWIQDSLPLFPPQRLECTSVTRTREFCLVTRVLFSYEGFYFRTKDCSSRAPVKVMDGRWDAFERPHMINDFNENFLQEASRTDEKEFR